MGSCQTGRQCIGLMAQSIAKDDIPNQRVDAVEGTLLNSPPCEQVETNTTSSKCSLWLPYRGDISNGLNRKGRGTENTAPSAVTQTHHKLNPFTKSHDEFGLNTLCRGLRTHRQNEFHWQLYVIWMLADLQAAAVAIHRAVISSVDMEERTDAWLAGS